jgi:hypothetical protein
MHLLGLYLLGYLPSWAKSVAWVTTTSHGYSSQEIHLRRLNSIHHVHHIATLCPSKISNRRKALQSTTSISMVSSSTSAMEAIPDRPLVFQGMDDFRNGNVKESIAKFDASVPPGARAYLWQRGISYYYNDDFALGSRQFRDDVRRSPLDVEEIVWDIACLLRMDNSKFPPPNMLSLPPGKKDRRPIMVFIN